MRDDGAGAWVWRFWVAPVRGVGVGCGVCGVIVVAAGLTVWMGAFAWLHFFPLPFLCCWFDCSRFDLDTEKIEIVGSAHNLGRWQGAGCQRGFISTSSPSIAITRWLQPRNKTSRQKMS